MAATLAVELSGALRGPGAAVRAAAPPAASPSPSPTRLEELRPPARANAAAFAFEFFVARPSGTAPVRAADSPALGPGAAARAVAPAATSPPPSRLDHLRLLLPRPAPFSSHLDGPCPSVALATPTAPTATSPSVAVATLSHRATAAAAAAARLVDLRLLLPRSAPFSSRLDGPRPFAGLATPTAPPAASPSVAVATLRDRATDATAAARDIITADGIATGARGRGRCRGRCRGRRHGRPRTGWFRLAKMT